MSLWSLDGIAPTLDGEGDDAPWMAHDANVIGQVALAARSSVWFGATLRGDNEPITIGAETNVQELCMLHTDPGFPLIVGAGCTVGHKAILHGCTVGDNTLIGMGAIVLNGATIGENCLIGAGALVPEGRDVPAGSLVVGAPGKAIRLLDADAIERLRLSAASYVANSRRFMRGMERL